MIVEQHVKRYQHRPGFRLADVADVGLPAYKLNVDAVTMAHKRIPPIEEFLLRCIGLEMSTPEDMAAFLGIGVEIVNSGLSSLAQTENIALVAESGQQRWSLTTKGRLTQATAELVAPEEKTIPIQFDAILRKPALYRPYQLLEFKELQSEGLIQIEVYPPKRPKLDELSAADLERLLRQTPASKERRRDILAIRGLDPRSIRKLYVRATALLFRGIEGDETQLAFVIDGKLSRDHENAFSQSEGFSRTVRSVEKRDPEEIREIQAAAAAAQLPTLISSMQERIQSSARNAEAAVAELSDQLTYAEDVEKQKLKSRLQIAEESLAKLKDDEKEFAVKYLYVTDHPPLLQDALLNAKQRLMIISPWIKAPAVDTSFLSAVEALLQRNVAIYIGYGISAIETQNLKQIHKDARDALRSLASRYKHFVLQRLGDTHAKVLIKDDEFAVVTSFNWLSFKGDPKLAFRDEQGVLLRRRELVEEKFFTELKRFHQGTQDP